MIQPDGEGRPPATMTTPHPDNAHPPAWRTDPFIGPDDEVEECFRSFEELGCHEYMWDWEGKDSNGALPALLLSRDEQFFRSRPLGSSLFLTVRLPHPHAETPGRLARVLADIGGAAEFARDRGFPSPPIFQVILPQTDSAEDLLEVWRTWEEVAEPVSSCDSTFPLQVIPLLESIDTLLACRRYLERYLALQALACGRFPGSLRVFIARSDPALEAGLVPAWLAAKSAIAEIHRLESAWGFPIHPILGVGSLPFRGGLSPRRLEAVLREYQGIRTVTIQSAFRFGYPHHEVRRAVAAINAHLESPSAPPELPDVCTLRALVDAFRIPYQETISAVADQINQVASLLPPRRSRHSPLGKGGYGRRVGTASVPRAIEFTAALYSLGVPPELIGTGRGFCRAKALGLLDVLEAFAPSLRVELREAGRYLCRRNLLQLAEEHHAWDRVVVEILALEDLLGAPLGPETPEDEAHAEACTEFLATFREGVPSLAALDAAARIRRSLG